MKLRHNPASPYVRKVMVCAHELGLTGKIELLTTAVSPVEVNATLAAENPLMKIPALTTDDGQVLFDSPVICEYLDSVAGGGKLFPAGAARWIALRQQALGDGILDALILCRYEIAARPEEKRFAGWTDAQMRKAHQGLAALEREDLSGVRTIGHVTAGCTLGYLDFRFPNDGWRARHAKLAAWYAGVEQLPSMQATKPAA
ncbi:MAG TPA: glutathione S-transferase [Stellaceae bacterium]|jgi:glutathione S-transferase|nr:glutathione S-transferase [Stellaceae bacterium]